MLSDVTYATDALDFTKILFDDSKKSMDPTYKLIVLYSLTFTSCLFGLNFLFRPLNRVHIRHVYEGRVSGLERIELMLANDPFIRSLVIYRLFVI